MKRWRALSDEAPSSLKEKQTFPPAYNEPKQYKQYEDREEQ